MNENMRTVWIGRAPDVRGAVRLGGPMRIIVPVSSAGLELLEDECRTACDARPDLVEWRADALLANTDPEDWGAALRAGLDLVLRTSSVPVLATIRTADEGGELDMDDVDYARLVRLLAERADAVDVEIGRTGASTLIGAVHSDGAIVVASVHDFVATPAPRAIDSLCSLMASSGADVLKFAFTPANESETAAILDAGRRARATHRRPVIAIGMGERGRATRLPGGANASAATFAAATRAGAPGQLSAEETRAALRAADSSSC